LRCEGRCSARRVRVLQVVGDHNDSCDDSEMIIIS